MEGQDPTALTAADVKALRTAEGVTFHHTDGTSFIRLHLNGPLNGEPWVFTASQQRLFPDPSGGDRSRTVLCGASITGHDERDRSSWVNDLSRAQCYLHGSPHRDTWRTAANLLRAGDRLTLQWVAGNNNGYLNDAALFNDELFLVVQQSHRPLTLMLAHAVCPDNTARMIRRH